VQHIEEEKCPGGDGRVFVSQELSGGIRSV
ncbi:MAG: hypothetical protein ACI84E_002450, partial [Planctomycetota bacterium]